nr:collagen alpha-2(V) chain-like [Gorilla gorilla gorilla]
MHISAGSGVVPWALLPHLWPLFYPQSGCELLLAPGVSAGLRPPRPRSGPGAPGARTVPPASSPVRGPRCTRPGSVRRRESLGFRGGPDVGGRGCSRGGAPGDPGDPRRDRRRQAGSRVPPPAAVEPRLERTQPGPPPPRPLPGRPGPPLQPLWPPSHSLLPESRARPPGLGVLEDGKSKMKTPTASVSDKGSLPGSQMVIFLLHPHVAEG